MCRWQTCALGSSWHGWLRDHERNPIRLYRILDKLEASSGGKRFLAELAPSGSWPQRGIYFFFEPGEVRAGAVTDSGLSE